MQKRKSNNNIMTYGNILGNALEEFFGYIKLKKSIVKSICSVDYLVD